MSLALKIVREITLSDPDCPECGGEGVVWEPWRWSSDGVRPIACPKCNNGGPDD